jgi:hypothetical protein
MFVVVHDIDIGPPVYIKPKTSAVLARAMASLSAKSLLEDPMSQFHFDKVCTCSRNEKAEKTKLYSAAADLVADENDLNTETVEGFAITAQSQLVQMGSDGHSGGEVDDSESSENEDEDENVEALRDSLLREDSMELSSEDS